MEMTNKRPQGTSRVENKNKSQNEKLKFRAEKSCKNTTFYG